MNTKWQQNGNGSLYYPGADGPVPSIRLEVLRDGIDDYDYLTLLQQATEQAAQRVAAQPDAGTQQLIDQAAKILAIDPEIASSMQDYTRDAGRLLRERDAIADLIEQLQAIQ